MTTAAPTTATLNAAQRSWLKQLAAELGIRLSDGAALASGDGTGIGNVTVADPPKALPLQARRPPDARRRTPTKVTGRVNPSKTVLAVSPSAQTKQGDKIELTANVTLDDATAKAAGLIQFDAVSNQGASRKSLAKVPLKDGKAVHKETTLPPGTYLLEATYIPAAIASDRSKSVAVQHNVVAVTNDEYETARKAALPKLEDCLVSAREFDLWRERIGLAKIQKEMIAAAKAALYHKARASAIALGQAADDYLKKAAEKQKEYDKTADEITKQLDAASDATRGDVARDIAKDMARKPNEVKYLRLDVRNRLLEEMQKGTFTDERKKATKILLSQRFLDPEFEKQDKVNRQKLVEKMKGDPDYKNARDNWGRLTVPQRVAILQKTIDYQADIYGFSKTTIDTFSERKGDMGTYRHRTEKVRLNTHDAVLKRGGFDEALDTIVHEMAHRQQALMADDLEPKPPNPAKIKKGDPLYNQAMSFKLNDNVRGFYVYPGDPPPVNEGKEYYTQPMENHSRINANAIKRAKIGR